MDAYASHLAEVNKIHSVVATADIHNSQGQLLVPKGTAIDSKAAEKIIKFKLLNPLEGTVAIENEFTPDKLLEQFEQFVSANTGLRDVEDKIGCQSALEKGCMTLCKNPVLRQKVTVLSLQLPKVFERALFCAWFSIAIFLRNKETNLNQNESELSEGFVAAMVHDMGLLHISPDAVSTTNKLSQEQWRQHHSHPLIAEAILRGIRGIPKTIIRGVAEHHENLDGTGFPKGKVGKQLGRLGQMLNLLDTTHAIFNKHFKPAADHSMMLYP